MYTFAEKLLFLKNILKFSIPVVLGALFSIVSIPLSTRIFDPAELGKINLFVIYTGVFTCVCCLGFDQAYVRFFHEPPNGKSPKVFLGWLVLIISSLFIPESALIVIFRKQFSQLILGCPYSDIYIYILVYVACNVFLLFSTLTYRMKEDIAKFTIAYLLSILNIKFFYVLSYFIGANALNAIMIIVCGQVTCMLYMMFFMVKEVDFSCKMHKEDFKQLALFALPLAPTMLMLMLNNYISQIVISRYLSFYMIGVYSSAIAIAGIITIIQGGFNIYWTAFVWKNYKTEQNKIQEVHHLITFIMIILALVIMLSQNVLYLLIGRAYRESQLFFPLLIITPIAYTISETTGLGISIVKKTYLSLIVIIITLGLNISLCIVLLPRLSLLGAALASAISAVARLSLLTFIGERYYTCVNNKLKLCAGVVALFSAAFLNVIFYEFPVLKYTGIICCFVIVIYVYRMQMVHLLLFFKEGLRSLLN